MKFQKEISRNLFLSLCVSALAVSPALAVPEGDGRCKKIQALIVDVQVTEGCTSPNRFCAEGTVEGNHGLNGTTYFRMDSVVRGPAAVPGSVATSGILVYTTKHGTLTVRESGLSTIQVGDEIFFTAFQEVLEGTGDYEGATGHMWLSGQRFPDHFEAGVTGELCTP